jgi:uroporphyrinogen-III decarboxylase
MFENPATPFNRVLDTWGKAGRGIIGGISTVLLTTGTPEQVRNHTKEVIEAGRKYPGFIISSCGGLHSSIPVENIITYFKTRCEMGIPAEL